MAKTDFPDPIIDLPPKTGTADATAVLAGGCFWCVEAVYLQLDGVKQVISGYAGGTAETANYQTVCSGTTNHAEAVMIRYDPSRLSYGQILKVFFWIAHNPTELNRQGHDVGRQYRSAIFYADPDEKRVAEAYIRQLDSSGVFPAPIVTTLEPLEGFYPAETHHQNYAARNPSQPYIMFAAAPKVEKLRARLRDRLKQTTS